MHFSAIIIIIIVIINICPSSIIIISNALPHLHLILHNLLFVSYFEFYYFYNNVILDGPFWASWWIVVVISNYLGYSLHHFVTSCTIRNIVYSKSSHERLKIKEKYLFRLVDWNAASSINILYFDKSRFRNLCSILTVKGSYMTHYIWLWKSNYLCSFTLCGYVAYST